MPKNFPAAQLTAAQPLANVPVPGGRVTFPIQGDPSITVQVGNVPGSPTFTGLQLVFEFSNDQGATWSPIYGLPLDTLINTKGPIPVTDGGATGTTAWWVPPVGTLLGVRAVALGAGPVNVLVDSQSFFGQGGGLPLSLSIGGGLAVAGGAQPSTQDNVPGAVLPEEGIGLLGNNTFDRWRGLYGVAFTANAELRKQTEILMKLAVLQLGYLAWLREPLGTAKPSFDIDTLLAEVEQKQT